MFRKLRNLIYKRWIDYMLMRFSDRENLALSKAYQRYWSDLPEEVVMEFFGKIEEIYSLPPGLLRPEDDINKLVGGDKQKKWYKPIKYGFTFSELELDLNKCLEKQMEKYNRFVKVDKIRTVNDLILVWCGREPKKDV